MSGDDGGRGTSGARVLWGEGAKRWVQSGVCVICNRCQLLSCLSACKNVSISNSRKFSLPFGSTALLFGSYLYGFFVLFIVSEFFGFCGQFNNCILIGPAIP